MSKQRDTIRQGGPRFVMVEHNVLDQAKLKPITFAVYCSLMMYANEDGYCFPSKRTLAGRAGVGITSVSKSIDELESLGLLEVSNRVDPMTGEMISNEYVVFRPSDISLKTPVMIGTPQSRDGGGQPRGNDPQSRGEVPPSREADGPPSPGGELNKNQLTRPNSELEDSASSRGDEREAPVPESKEQPYPMLERVLSIQGAAPGILTGPDKGKQLAVAKRLITSGVTIEEAGECASWLLKQSWVDSVSMFLVEKKLSDFRIAKARAGSGIVRPGEIDVESRRGMTAKEALGKYYQGDD